jgi:hypothetical protein
MSGGNENYFKDVVMAPRGLATGVKKQSNSKSLNNSRFYFPPNPVRLNREISVRDWDTLEENHTRIRFSILVSRRDADDLKEMKTMLIHISITLALVIATIAAPYLAPGLVAAGAAAIGATTGVVVSAAAVAAATTIATAALTCGMSVANFTYQTLATTGTIYDGQVASERGGEMEADVALEAADMVVGCIPIVGPLFTLGSSVADAATTGSTAARMAAKVNYLQNFGRWADMSKVQRAIYLLDKGATVLGLALAGVFMGLNFTVFKAQREREMAEQYEKMMQEAKDYNQTMDEAIESVRCNEDGLEYDSVKKECKAEAKEERVDRLQSPTFLSGAGAIIGLYFLLVPGSSLGLTDRKSEETFGGVVVVACVLAFIAADMNKNSRLNDAEQATGVPAMRLENSAMLTKNPKVTCEIEEGKMSCFYATCSTHEGPGTSDYRRGDPDGCPIGVPIVGMRDRGENTTYLSKKNSDESRAGATSLREAQQMAITLNNSYRTRMSSRMYDLYRDTTEGLCEILPGQQTCFALRCSAAMSDPINMKGFQSRPRDNGQDNGCPLCVACDTDKYGTECASCLERNGLSRNPDANGSMFEVSPGNEVGWYGRRPWIVARERWGGYSLCQAVETVAEGFRLRVVLNQPEKGWTSKRPVQVCRDYQNFSLSNKCEWTKMYTCPGSQNWREFREITDWQFEARQANRNDAGFMTWLRQQYREDADELYNYCCAQGMWAAEVSFRSTMGLGDIMLQKRAWPPPPPANPTEFTQCYLSEEDYAWRSTGKGDRDVRMEGECAANPGKFAALKCATKSGCKDWERCICGGCPGQVLANIGVGLSMLTPIGAIVGAATNAYGKGITRFGVACNAERAPCVAYSDNYNSVTKCRVLGSVKTEFDAEKQTIAESNASLKEQCLVEKDASEEACAKKINMSEDFSVDDMMCLSEERRNKWGGYSGRQTSPFIQHPFSRGVMTSAGVKQVNVPEASSLLTHTGWRGNCSGTEVRTVCSLNVLDKRPRMARDRLLMGEYLLGGQELYSPTGGYRLMLTGSGTLYILDHFNTLVWSQSISSVSVPDRRSVRLMLHSDGVLAIEVKLSASWVRKWSSNVKRSGECFAVIQDNGALVCYQSHSKTDVPYYSSLPTTNAKTLARGADRRADPESPMKTCVLLGGYKRDGDNCRSDAECLSGNCHTKRSYSGEAKYTCGITVAS